MNYLKYYVICCFIMIVWMNSVCVSAEEPTVSVSEEKQSTVITETLKKLKEIYNEDAEEKIIQSAAGLLNNKTGVRLLLSRLSQSEEYRYEIRQILRSLPDRKEVEDLTVERFETEDDPIQKSRLISILSAYNGENTLDILFENLDDKRRVIRRVGGEVSESRICDKAYDVIDMIFLENNIRCSVFETHNDKYLERAKASGAKVKRIGGPILGGDDDKDEAISRLKEYWKENRSQILKDLEEKRTRVKSTEK